MNFVKLAIYWYKIFIVTLCSFPGQEVHKYVVKHPDFVISSLHSTESSCSQFREQGIDTLNIDRHEILDS